MRHFGSLLTAAVFAPSIFLLTGTGLSAFNSALDDNKLNDPLGSLAALGALLLAGILYAILVMARLSPLGPGLAGLASLAVSGWALYDVEAYKGFFAQLDVHMGGAVGETGLGIMLAMPLLATLFSGRRWRRGELYAPQAIPVRSPGEPARVLPALPVDQSTAPPEPELPDIAPPSLRYPTTSWRASPLTPPASEPEPPASSGDFTPPVSEAPSSDLPAMQSFAERLHSWSSGSQPPTPIVMAESAEASPLPRRVPSPPPGKQDVTEPIVSPPPPPDNEVTERLGPPGSIVPVGNEDDTVQTRQNP